ncbi:hypothetical protein [Novosphingobium soli]|uniref:DUF3300 domain-containing protein n=1 Tax=Novosphingobium soli TaxID=574956 RepID=A0ABV6CZH1_9SPHN
MISASVLAAGALLALPAIAQPAPASPAAAPTPTASAPASGAAYSSAVSTLGDLLDNPATKAVLQKHVPDLIANSNIEMARGMTLRSLQSYAGDALTDAKLAAIDADLAKVGK